MKFFAAVLFFCCFVTKTFSDEYLIGVQNLARDRWKSSGVIEVVDNTYLILATENFLNQFSHERISWHLIDINPRKRNNENYYILFPIAETPQRIMSVAEICASYDNFLIVRVKKENEEAFFSLKAEKNLLKFTPYIFRDSIPEELKKVNVYQYQDIIPEIIKEVNQDSLRSYVKKLENFSTRKASQTSQEVCPWLVEKFKEHGADTVYTESVSNYGPNVIAIRYGTSHDPKKYCLIGGHLDAVVSGPPAAGADDNASGTAAALEAMRVLSKFKFEHTIRCIAWNAEETGLRGSAVNARNAQKNNEEIIGGVINLDMIGYKKQTPTLFIHHRTSVAGNAEFAKLFKQMADTYVKFNVTLVTSSEIMGASDHSSYWSNGYVAFLGIEAKGRSGLCPNYHGAGDRLDNPGGLNCSELMTNSTKAGVATLAHLAKPSATNIEKNVVLNPENVNSLTITKSSSGAMAAVQFTVVENGARVSVMVYDLHGKQCMILTDKAYTKGNYSVSWPVKQNGSGVYVIQCRQGSTVYSQKYVSLP